MNRQETGNAANEAVLDFMRTRRSVPAKTMGGPGPGEAEVLEMAKIASRIPDHGKIAPWRFIHYSDAAKTRLDERIFERAREKFPDLAGDALQIESGRMARSPAVIGLVSAPREHPKVPAWEQKLSCGAAGLAWLIAANAHGYDAQWLTEWIAFDEVLAPEFGCREGERIAGFIHIGTRTAPKTERDRPEIGAVFTRMD